MSGPTLAERIRNRLTRRRSSPAETSQPSAPGSTTELVAEFSSPQHASALLGEIESSGPLTDEEFIAAAYRRILEREVDDYGRASCLRLLQAGKGRGSIVGTLLLSEEHVNRVVADHYTILNLREFAPERFEVLRTITGDADVPVVRAESPADFDWLEQAILENGYYEKPGVWSLGIDVDKRVMAEILSAFSPVRPLEIGCASGAVLECLDEREIRAEGVEISQMAIERAHPRVKDRIHVGDLLELDLPSGYDLVYGLDVFEHLNPNRLDAYLGEIARVLTPSGFVYANIPAFGRDEVFGTVLPITLAGWQTDADAGRLFSRLEVDDDGYPFHGHLIWADSPWWVKRFHASGLHRVPEIERALHEKYDDYMRRACFGRRALYVFSLVPDPVAVSAIAERIASSPSTVIPSTAV